MANPMQEVPRENMFIEEDIPVLPLRFDTTICKIPMHLARHFVTCPLCQGKLNKVTAITGCLHRFCENCIKKYLTTVSMSCPMCHMKLYSLRQLRADVEYGRLLVELNKV
eukprot:jgi/Galph1/2402/GphlegSOOS_G1068.1